MKKTTTQKDYLTMSDNITIQVGGTDSRVYDPEKLTVEKQYKRGHRCLEMMGSSDWLITKEALLSMVDIASREKVDIEALQSKLGRKLENTRSVTMRGNVAIIPFSGPVFRHANLFTEISGATSLEVFSKEFSQAVLDDRVETIIIDMDSPGGQVSGISEMAQMIRDSDKKVVSYVSNLAASAGYWIASAADEVVTANTGMLGSIGVVSTIQTDDDSGIVKVISSQSPLKQKDVRTEEGRQQAQNVTDSLADVFINAVAEYRGVTAETVMGNFGQGGVLVGESAVKAGMADRVDTLENLIAGLSGNQTRGITMGNETKPKEVEAPKLSVETLKANHPDIYQAVLDQGASAERERIKGIEALSMKGHESLIEQLKFDGSTSPEGAAVQVLKAEKSNRESALQTQREEAPTALAPTVPEPKHQEKDNMTHDEQIAHVWNSNASVREEFDNDFDSYKAFEDATANGSARIQGGK